MNPIFDANKPSIYRAQNDFYCIVDKNGRVQVTGTFDQCFDELADLVSKCPSFGWTMGHVKDGTIVYVGKNNRLTTECVYNMEHSKKE